MEELTMTQAPEVSAAHLANHDRDGTDCVLTDAAAAHDTSAFAELYPETAALILALGAEIAAQRGELEHYKRLFAGAASSPLARSVLGTLGLNVADLDPARITGAGKLSAAAAGWPDVAGPG